MTIDIRKTTAEDEIAVAAVEASATATLRLVYGPSPRARHQLDNQGNHISRLVACANGNVVGTLRYWIEGARLHVLGLGVHQDYRRRGISRAMIEHLTDLARTRDLARISLYTIRQTGNVPIFQRLGFRIISEELDHLMDSHVNEPLTEVYMELPVILPPVAL